MARGTSVNFKAVKNLRHEDRHNRREGKGPRYLLPPEHRLRDSRGQVLESVIVRNDPGLHERYMARLAQCSERAKRAKAFSPFWSGVVVLPLRDPGESVDAYRDRLTQTMVEWCQGYEALTGHEVLQCALHFDEGHREEPTGEVCPNPHAHVLVDRMRERAAHVIQTRAGERRIPARVSVIELDRETMRRVQDMTCRVVTGESAAGRRARVTARRETARPAGLQPRGHINHREYRAMMQEAARERQRERVTLQARIDALEAEVLECSRDLGEVVGMPPSFDPMTPDNRRRVFCEALDQVRRARQERTDYEALEHRAAEAEKAAREARRDAQDTKFHSTLVARALERAGADAQAAEAAHPEKITPEDITCARRAIESHARGRGISIDEGYRSLRAAWMAENEREARVGHAKPYAQQDYSALKLAHLELQAERRAARTGKAHARAPSAGRTGAHARGRCEHGRADLRLPQCGDRGGAGLRPALRVGRRGAVQAISGPGGSRGLHGDAHACRIGPARRGGRDRCAQDRRRALRRRGRAHGERGVSGADGAARDA